MAFWSIICLWDVEISQYDKVKDLNLKCAYKSLNSVAKILFWLIKVEDNAFNLPRV